MNTQPYDSPAGPPLVSVTGLRKTYGDTVAVHGADLTLRAGEVHALCGHNGAGKSTVVKMLSGQESPEAGTISVAGEVVELRNRGSAQLAGIALVDQELSVVPALTVAENLFLGDRSAGWVHRRRQERARARAMLDEMGLAHVHPDQPLRSLGLGERQLVEIARAMGQRARVVILDEPTATLSDVESERVYAAVRRVAAAGCSVLFVSHRLGEVLQLCDRVTVMRDGRVVTVADTAKLTVQSLIRHILGETPENSPKRPADVGQVALQLHAIAVPGRFENLSLDAHAGTVYALAGQVGSGASEVLRGIAGLEPAIRGRVTVGGRPLTAGDPVAASKGGIAFASNDRKSEGLFLRRPVGTNLMATRIPSFTQVGAIRSRAWRACERRLAASCGLQERLEVAVGDLSGGNQQKVFVARALARPDVKVLLLDEPTRGVDVGGRAAIHRLVRQAAADGMTVLFASTELDELVELADVVVTFHKGEVVAQHDSVTSGDALLFEMTHGTAVHEVGGAP
ncbi:sugar ABC transporter ATP-binding protein [Streptomyces griseorubiginosus]|uniref:sugar ABC transporter ATP-binding protein n=1 Tax=Streptomyces griseorubiginosus TaxID=67304 RepID=UPI0036EE42DE